MKTNLYFRSVIRHQSRLKIFLIYFLLSGFSLPRLSIEVFIKRNFGPRYFSTGVAVLNIIILLILPLPLHFIGQKLDEAIHGYGYLSNSSFAAHYLTWYLFIIIFAYFAYLRRKEINYQPSTFDFEKFSLFSGDLHPVLANFWRSRTNSIRTREIFLEPLPFLIIGIILIFLQQQIGWMIALASLMYAGSFAAQYHDGDEFVYDRIDNTIANEELERTFVDDMEPGETRGFQMRTRKPTSIELRRKLSESFIEDTEEAVLEAR